MSKRLPGAARPVNTIETAGDLIEVNLRLLFAAGEHALQIDLVTVVFGELFRTANGELDKFPRNRVGIGV